MIYTHSFQGITARTGDILFTRDGESGSLFGEIWKLLGYILPGDLDHCAMYLGPGVRFVESAARGVVVCEFAGDAWTATPYAAQRLLIDELVGIGDPIAGRGIALEQEIELREHAVAYCLAQAAEQKPYNIDFFNPQTDGAFYCSQLVYKAYAAQGIDLHVHAGESANSLLAPIVFPEDVWNACHARRTLQPNIRTPSA
jgi:hypothetical protein